LINISEQKKYTAWVEFEKGERYLIEYIPYKDFKPKDEAFHDIFLNKVHDWRGIRDENGTVKFTKEKFKEFVILGDENIEVKKRLIFISRKMIDPETFFDGKSYAKNLKVA